MAAFFAFKYIYMRPILRGSSPPTNNLHRVPFYLIFSLIMLTILHGASVIKVLIILSVNYALAKATGGTRLAVPVTWIFNGCVLLANEWYEGYAFGNLHLGFAFLVSLTLVLTSLLIHFCRTRGAGCIHVGTSASTLPCSDLCRSVSTTTGLAIMSELRMCDVPFPLCASSWTNVEQFQPGGELSDKKRPSVFHPRATYTFLNYLAYALYAPLYIAGPILTFNDFMWQVCSFISDPHSATNVAI